ncbi:MAG: acyltransferase [Salinicola sp.]|uniref:acyltransferase family protein n=1 Tax=Salinicola sp. TaxID=1978524 RepID=UPI001DFA3BA6|nr:acyltransferase family protein [Salinicola sp.]NRB56848.1 acyltransferase [Salinicola sp.]
MGKERKYLYEIQGLRAVAALMVAVYHIWIQRVSGGVDVFFVVAAFFVVGSLTRRAPLSLADVLDYYGKTLRRLLPGAALVVCATILLSMWLMPDSMWRNQIKHGMASILFLENWSLALTATDYLQQGAPPSPFQQLWALAVQVQFYFAFPLLLWAGLKFDARRGRRDNSFCVLLLLAVTVLSLCYSIYITDKNQSWAYFDTFARAWEFALGGLLALGVSRVSLSPPAAKVLGWVSLIVLTTFALFLDVSTLFPGVVALVPVLAAAGIVIAARNRCDMRLLNNRFVVWFGDMSFSFYLWHWPLLSFYRYATGEFDVGLLPGLAIIGGAGVLAFVTTWALETPVRRSPLLSRRRVYTYGVCVLLMAFPLASLAVWYQDYQGRSAAARSELATFLRAPDVAGDDLQPSTLIASLDLPASSYDGCHQNYLQPGVRECTYGDPEADYTVVLAGGSHAQHWLAALRVAAEREKFRLISMTKGACMLSTDPHARYQVNPSCLAWNREALERLGELKPDLVFTTATRGQGPEERVPEGYRQVWRRLADSGIDVLAIRDNPWYGFDVPKCVDLQDDPSVACSIPRRSVLKAQSPTDEVQLPNVQFADLSDLFCDDQRCSPLRDNVLVYRDDHHITNTFSYLAADRIIAALDRAESRFDDPPRGR